MEEKCLKIGTTYSTQKVLSCTRLKSRRIKSPQKSVIVIAMAEKVLLLHASCYCFGLEPLQDPSENVLIDIVLHDVLDDSEYVSQTLQTAQSLLVFMAFFQCLLQRYEYIVCRHAGNSNKARLLNSFDGHDCHFGLVGGMVDFSCGTHKHLLVIITSIFQVIIITNRILFTTSNNFNLTRLILSQRLGPCR